MVVLAVTVIEILSTTPPAEIPPPLRPRVVAVVVGILMIGGGLLAALAPPEPLPTGRAGVGTPTPADFASTAP
ncbi:MAG: hypothetical protein P8J50_01500 [Acidimicrobiales bacterium]|nr:hypothetical protein [Acidimicrobiales bacterium]